MDSPDIADAKPAFRKPSNDAAHRKYRRPSSTTPSPPPDGSPESKGYVSENLSVQDSSRETEDGHQQRKNYNRGLDHHSSPSFRDYRKHADCREEKEKDHSRAAPWYFRDSKDCRDYDRVTNRDENKWSRDAHKYSRSRDKYDGTNDKSRHGERDFSSSYMDKERYTREKDLHNETRSSRSTQRDVSRSSYDDSRWTRNGPAFVKETRDEYKRSESQETKQPRERERDTRGSREDRQDEMEFRSRRPHSPSKRTKFSRAEKCDILKDLEPAQETSFKTTTQQSSCNDANTTENLDAAKVAAMRAAELVNKNLIGASALGTLSTDQKKKLLWGSKKKAAEESGNCWDASLFPDREQQEKFNRLMGVKGEERVVNQEGKGVLLVEKQKELQLNLEKQYTAGLRRKDGRTVGLGL